MPVPSPAAGSRRLVGVYHYFGEVGELLFEVLRWDPKTFSQRQPDGRGGWRRDAAGKLTMAGTRWAPYHLDQLAAAAAELRDYGVVPEVLIVEGERDADRLLRGGVLATTNAGGAGKWDPAFAHYFAGFEIVLIPDNDRPGRDHMHQVARSLLPVAASVKMLDLRVDKPGGDFSDWAALGHTRGDLKRLIKAAPALTPADLPAPAARARRPAARLPERVSPYARRALELAVRGIRTAPNGQQQATLNREVFNIAQLAAAGQLPEGEALAMLQNAAADMPAYDPRRPWRPAELDRLVKRAFEQGLRQPRRDLPERRHG